MNLIADYDSDQEDEGCCPCCLKTFDDSGYPCDFCYNVYYCSTRCYRILAPGHLKHCPGNNVLDDDDDTVAESKHAVVKFPEKGCPNITLHKPTTVKVCERKDVILKVRLLEYDHLLSFLDVLGDCSQLTSNVDEQVALCPDAAVYALRGSGVVARGCVVSMQLNKVKVHFVDEDDVEDISIHRVHMLSEEQAAIPRLVIAVKLQTTQLEETFVPGTIYRMIPCSVEDAIVSADFVLNFQLLNDVAKYCTTDNVFQNKIEQTYYGQKFAGLIQAVMSFHDITIAVHPGDESSGVFRISRELATYYENTTAPSRVELPLTGQLPCALLKNGSYLRVVASNEATENLAMCEYVDTGEYEIEPLKSLRPLPLAFLALPKLSFLASIPSLAEEYSDDATAVARFLALLPPTRDVTLELRSHKSLLSSSDDRVYVVIVKPYVTVASLRVAGHGVTIATDLPPLDTKPYLNECLSYRVVSLNATRREACVVPLKPEFLALRKENDRRLSSAQLTEPAKLTRDQIAVLSENGVNTRVRIIHAMETKAKVELLNTGEITIVYREDISGSSVPAMRDPCYFVRGSFENISEFNQLSIGDELQLTMTINEQWDNSHTLSFKLTNTLSVEKFKSGQKVQVTKSVGPRVFFVLLRKDSSLQSAIETCAATASGIKDPKQGMWVVAFSRNDQLWCRALIEQVYDGRVLVNYLDWGDYEEIDFDQIVEMAASLMSYKLQGCSCGLADVEPASGDIQWSEEAFKTFNSLVTNKRFRIEVVDMSGKVRLFPLRDDLPDGVEIGEQLVELGLARRLKIAKS